MAKDYKRHSTGGRFKRPDIGDAGIRSLKEQQRDIIQSIKVRAAQDKEISNQQISGFDRATSKEQENRQVLKNLENDIFKNKTQNIKVHAGNEIDRLEGEAKELGKKSEFWKNFSTTYSQQFAMAAEKVLDFKDRLWADKYGKLFATNFPEIIKFEADYFREDTTKLLTKELIETDWKAELKNTPEDNKERRVKINTILDLLTRSNEDLDNIKVKTIIENINSLEKDLQSTILNDIQSNPESKLKWNSATIIGHYEQAAINLIIRAKIKPNSAQARKLHATFLAKGKAKAAKYSQGEDFIKSETQLLHSSKAVVANTDPTKVQEKLFNLYKACEAGTYKTQSGYTTLDGDPKAIAQCMGQNLAPHYTDEKTYLKTIGQFLVPSHKDSSKKIPIFERNPQWQEDFSKIWNLEHDERISQLGKTEKINNELTFEKITTKLQDPDFNLSKEGLSEIEKISMENGGGGEKVQTLLATARVFDFGSKDKYLLTQRLKDEWGDGNYEDFMELYRYVDSDTKKVMLSLKQDLDEQRTASWFGDGKGIRNHAEQQVKTIVKKEQVLGSSTGDDAHIVSAYKTLFQIELASLKKEIPDINKRGIEAMKNVDEMLKKGEGIFRRTGEGGNTIWLAFNDEPKSAKEPFTDEEVENELTQTPTARYNNANTLITNHKKSIRLLIHQDVVDGMLIDIANGKTVAIPPVLEKLYKINPGNHETIEEFVNDTLGTNIPISAESRNTKLEKEKYSLMRIPKKELYSKKDLAFIHGYMQEFDGWSTSTQFDGFVAAAGGLDNIDIDYDPTYDFLNDPDRDYSMYYR